MSHSLFLIKKNVTFFKVNNFWLIVESLLCTNYTANLYSIILIRFFINSSLIYAETLIYYTIVHINWFDFWKREFFILLKQIKVSLTIQLFNLELIKYFLYIIWTSLLISLIMCTRFFSIWKILVNCTLVKEIIFSLKVAVVTYKSRLIWEVIIMHIFYLLYLHIHILYSQKNYRFLLFFIFMCINYI